MGYTSTMLPEDFLSKYSPEEITERYNAFRATLKSSPKLQKVVGDDGEYLDDYYIFVSEKEKDVDGIYTISLECSDGDYSAKHYSSEALAFFVSTVINDGSFCELLFEGEDGECWGWEIGHLYLRVMTKEWVKTKHELALSEKEYAQLLLSS